MGQMEATTDPITLAISRVPRRSPCIPSPDGTYILFTERTYTPETNSEKIITQVCKTVDVQNTKRILPECEGAASLSWLEDDTLIWTKDGGENASQVWTMKVSEPTPRAVLSGCLRHRASQMKVRKRANGSGFALTYMASRPSSPPKHHGGSGLLYTDMPVRMLCAYADEKLPITSIFLTILAKEGPSSWVLNSEPPRDVLQGLDLSFPPWLAFDNSYQLCPDGVYVSAVGPHFDTSRTFSGELYYVPFQAPQLNLAKTRLGLSGWTGMPHSVSVSPGGENWMLFLQSQRWDTTFDHDTVFLVKKNDDCPGEAIRVRLYLKDSRDSEWQPQIVSVQWSSETSESCLTAYIVVEEQGNKEAWQVQLKPSTSNNEFVGLVTYPLLQSGCITSLTPFSKSDDVHVLVNRSTFDAPSITEVVSIPTIDSTAEPHVTLVDEIQFTESKATHQEISIPSADSKYNIQAFLHKPAGLQGQDEKRPVVLLVHGGPSDAWRNTWTRNWNPHLWTSQGFVVITPNISGSTGFGLPFALSVHQSWGGRPLADISSVLDHLSQNSSQYGIDMNRVVAAGPSFGGFLLNFLAGHPGLASRFRGLIIHGGIFSVQNLLAADVPVVFAADFGGMPWERKAEDVWKRWNPAVLSGEWTTPMLFTHGNIDYRVPITEALAAFQACRLRGVPAELLVFPDEAHQIQKSANLLQWQSKMLEWSLRWTVEGNSHSS